MRTFQINLFSRQAGMSLIEVILGAAILALTAVSIPQLMKLMSHSSAQSQAIRVSVTERTKIEAYLKNHAAWTQTLQKNPSFACGTTNTGCSANVTNNGFYDFVLYSEQANEKLTYDPGDPMTRMTLQGNRCPAGVTDPSERCPIRFQASWKPICASYPCINPTLQINVTLSTTYGPNPDDVIPINAAKYSYSVVRSFNEDDVQSACFALNGTYNSISNTCYPPHAGRTCVSLGKPAQIVTGVNTDGTIDCSPFFHNACNPATQMMVGVTTVGAAVCGAQPPPTPVIDCVGNWGACSAACNGGTQTYTITTPASGGGAACPFATGATQACNTQACPVNCVGSWQPCTQPCGGGTSTFVVTTPAANGGSACIANNGDVMACNTQACAIPVDCAGTWSPCDTSTGTQIFTVTQAPQNGGAACPASPQNCTVNCVGGWGACAAGVQTYTWSITPKNGGTACAYVNGATSACAPPYVQSTPYLRCQNTLGLDATGAPPACSWTGPLPGGPNPGSLPLTWTFIVPSPPSDAVSYVWNVRIVDTTGTVTLQAFACGNSSTCSGVPNPSWDGWQDESNVRASVTVTTSGGLTYTWTQSGYIFTWEN